MRRIKNILLIVALMVAGIPCIHAESHQMHQHHGDAGAELCSNHTCACHPCDAADACEDLDYLQVVNSTTAPLACSSPPIELFVLDVQTQNSPKQLLIPRAMLSSIQTVRLLI